ncbi:MAG: DUF6382 domain-containing protein, partial [Anaerovoracaceae bacterium]
ERRVNMWDNREFKVELNENSVRDFEKIMLMSGQCSFFMPMGFMGSEKGETVYYDCSGFAPLSRYRIERTEDALYILEKTLIILGKSVEYFITPAKITLNTNTIFYNKDTGEIKVTYVPERREKVNLRKNIVKFINQLKTDICDGNEEYLDRAIKYVYYNNYYIKDMVNKIGIFKRQIYMNKNSN